MITVKMPSNVDLTLEYLRQLVFTLNRSIDDTNALRIRKINASGSASLGDGLIMADAAGGAITIDLLPAAQTNQKVFSVIKTDASANAVTLAPDGSETINGAASASITAQYGALKLISDGFNYYQL